MIIFVVSYKSINAVFVILGTSWSFLASSVRGVMSTLLEAHSITVLHPRSSSVQYVECCPTRPSGVVKLWRGFALSKVFLLATCALRSKLLLMHWGLFACLLVARYFNSSEVLDWKNNICLLLVLSPGTPVSRGWMEVPGYCCYPWS